MVNSLWSFSIFMNRYLFILLCFFGIGLFAQPNNDSLNMKKLIHYPFSEWIDTNVFPLGSDIWGYSDSSSGEEYAIVGNKNGVLIANITSSNQIGNTYWYSGSPCIWRDIKTYGHYAYVVHDVPSGSNPVYDGLMIIDLDSLSILKHKNIKLPVPRYNGQVDTMARAHNLWIDDNGILYAFGSNVGVGGALLFDLSIDPWNPVFKGIYNNHAFHDGFSRNDTLYGAALYSGVVAVDFTLKTNPQLIRTWPTPGNFCHNTWLSDDNNFLFTTDEVSDGYISAYDISDLNNVNELFRHRVQPNTSLIPHNTHVLGSKLITSYYTFGLHVLDVEFPELPVLSGYYDTSPSAGGGFNGAWGAYPYLPSGRILVSDRQEGLFVLEPEYIDVSRLHIQLGHVDVSSGGNIKYGNASGKDFVFFKNKGDTIYADDNGVVIYGSLGTTLDTIVYPFTSASGIQTFDSLIVTLGSGTYPHDTLIASVFSEREEIILDPFEVVSSDEKWILKRFSFYDHEISIRISDINGREIYKGTWIDNLDKFIQTPRAAGFYILSYKIKDAGEGSIRLFCN